MIRFDVSRVTNTMKGPISVGDFQLHVSSKLYEVRFVLTANMMMILFHEVRSMLNISGEAKSGRSVLAGKAGFPRVSKISYRPTQADPGLD